jgi:hypothetical protein
MARQAQNSQTRTRSGMLLYAYRSAGLPALTYLFCPRLSDPGPCNKGYKILEFYSGRNYLADNRFHGFEPCKVPHTWRVLVGTQQ